MTEPRPRPPAGPRRVRGGARAPEPGGVPDNAHPADPRRVLGLARPDPLRDRLRGPWRVAVADRSMRPAIEPGDWLLVDPTVGRWPRRGSIVVFREPGDGTLAIKRVAGRPGDWVPFADGFLRLADDEAWLIGDATDEDLALAGSGVAIDSRHYGPVPVDRLVGRAWFRYGPLRRAGRLPHAPGDLLARGRATTPPVGATEFPVPRTEPGAGAPSGADG